MGRGRGDRGGRGGQGRERGQRLVEGGITVPLNLLSPLPSYTHMYTAEPL